MVKPLDSLAVANWFVDTAEDHGQEITTMKLQKLTFLAYGWCLALYDKPLVTEMVQACSWGPMFRDIYDASIGFGSGPITSPLTKGYSREYLLVPKNDPRVPLLQRIWDIYSGYSRSQLSQMVTESGGSWHTTWNKYPGRRNVSIEDALIKSEFKGKL